MYSKSVIIDYQQFKYVINGIQLVVNSNMTKPNSERTLKRIEWPSPHKCVDVAVGQVRWEIGGYYPGWRSLGTSKHPVQRHKSFSSQNLGQFWNPSYLFAPELGGNSLTSLYWPRALSLVGLASLTRIFMPLSGMYGLTQVAATWFLAGHDRHTWNVCQYSTVHNTEKNLLSRCILGHWILGSISSRNRLVQRNFARGARGSRLVIQASTK